MMNFDKFIISFDQALRTVLAPAISQRPTPGEADASFNLTIEEKQEAARLMRINHSGEVCAQALYQGQSLTAKNPKIQHALDIASLEEIDHLAWCETRIQELGGRKSILNPLWYSASFMIGAFSGLLGDRWNLGFLVETERQVEAHLQNHLGRFASNDFRSQAIVAQMKLDEASHAQSGIEHGAAELPFAIKIAMKLTSKVMTQTAYWV